MDFTDDQLRRIVALVPVYCDDTEHAYQIRIARAIIAALSAEQGKEPVEYQMKAKRATNWTRVQGDTPEAQRVHMDEVNANYPGVYDSRALYTHPQSPAPQPAGFDAWGNEMFTDAPSQAAGQAVRMLTQPEIQAIHRAEHGCNARAADFRVYEAIQCASFEVNGLEGGKGASGEAMEVQIEKLNLHSKAFFQALADLVGLPSRGHKGDKLGREWIDRQEAMRLMPALRDNAGALAQLARSAIRDRAAQGGVGSADHGSVCPAPQPKGYCEHCFNRFGERIKLCDKGKHLVGVASASNAAAKTGNSNES